MPSLKDPVNFAGEGIDDFKIAMHTQNFDCDNYAAMDSLEMKGISDTDKGKLEGGKVYTISGTRTDNSETATLTHMRCQAINQDRETLRWNIRFTYIPM